MQRAMMRERTGLSLIVVSPEEENLDAQSGLGCHPEQSSGSDHQDRVATPRVCACKCCQCDKSRADVTQGSVMSQSLSPPARQAMKVEAELGRTCTGGF